ncbi:MAG: DUF5103 domain-containing protein [Prevotella sp.]|nr:DUF5103 domain-containing protein [Prevotella sp.]
MKNFLILFLLFLLGTTTIDAQRNEILSSRIASLQVVAGDDWLSIPVVSLGQQTPIQISFDDLTHEYHRYSYRVEHCEADWTPSEELFESDYCMGFASGNTIEDFGQSLNVNQLYTHYTFQIPNDRCQLKMSGNYRVTVYDEHNEDAPVFTACFMVVESLMGIGMEMTTITDADINNRHQQLEMKLSYGNMTVTDPATQIKTVVMQNGRWDNAVVNTKPQYVMGNGLQWSHNRDLIFNGGNEYRKFEMLDVTHTTMGLENIDWDGSRYHAWIWTDEPRPSYVYDEDANGAFYIRNSDNIDNDVQSEYLMAHFRLKSPRLPGDVYINGWWTNDRFLPEYQMQWNEEKQEYEAAVWLKQGYYSYQYLMMQSDGTMVPVPSEGNFYQTENSYQALIYFRGNGDRTDRLVAYGTVKN